MGSIVSAITGSGSSKAAGAQADAAGKALVANRQSLMAQLSLGLEALDLQKELFNTAAGYTAPYRDAGTTALARYESLLYGIPINQTSSYQSSQSERERAYNAALDSYNSNNGLPLDAVPYTPKGKPAGNYFLSKDKIYNVIDGQVFYDTIGEKSTDWYTDWKPVDKGQAPEMGSDPFAGMDTSQAFDFTATPSYEFRLSEGEKALERSAAARSGVLSGAQAKALTKYGQDMGTQEYDNVLNRLAGLIDTGANAAAGTGNQAITTGQVQAGILNNMSNSYANAGQTAANLETQIGAAKASGYLGKQAAGTNLLNNGFQLAGMFA